MFLDISELHKLILKSIYAFFKAGSGNRTRIISLEG